ncbi:enoyl-CoA hydratase/isomerase family protein [Novosphingobium sp.]|uniref:enoyl-CoA hydratase/isomerase family protein n=1 Tax=Novosphingobium sp. TaxID=1874826 RepID=UPI0035B19519
MPAPSDLLGAESLSPLSGCQLVVLGPGDPVPAAGVSVLVDRAGELPPVDPARFDALVTTRGDAPAPWVSVAAERLDDQLAAITATAAQNPVATTMLARVLQLGEALDFEAALEVESLAYSALLGGGEFARWLETAPREPSGVQAAEPVRYARDGDSVTLTLASPGNRNAMTAAMRDALYEALANVLEDPSLPSLTLRAEGRCFSTGGDLPEFGSARDLAAAHVIRTQRSCARLLHRLGSRASVVLNGACIGSGIEVPAAAARRIGAGDLIVQLPELRMGLIPGAGGTVSVARAIGRHRLMWLALGAFRIGAKQALSWGLIHEIAP